MKRYILFSLSLLFFSNFVYGQASWTRYSGNPIGNISSGTISSPSVIFDNGIYKMWLDIVYIIRYATSNDGINWSSFQPITLSGDATYEGNGQNEPCVVKVGTTYHMWYLARQGFPETYVKYATSNDGINWTRHGRVISTGSGYSNGVNHAYVLYENGIFKMWGMCSDGAVAAGGGPWHSDLFYATSTDGVNWTTLQKLPGFIAAGINENRAYGYQVVTKSDGAYYLWYRFNDGTTNHNKNYYYATSTDGKNFMKQGLAFSSGATGSWESTEIVFGDVMVSQTEFRLWYIGYDNSLAGRIGYATSPKVVDTTPPELKVTLSPDNLWPPNHKMVNITASIEVKDNSDPSPVIKLVSISINESDNGKGDGNTLSDIQNVDFGTDDRNFLLRSERSGIGEGRVYTIIYSASDISKNTSYDTVYVTIVHDKGKMKKTATINLPDSYDLFQNYPNPFNPETEIRYQLSKASNVSLTIYNLMGQEIKKLVNKYQGAGYYSVKWDGTNNIGIKVASGIYIYRIQAGSFVNIKKMVFLQ